jgi:hypothetical protein
MSSDEMSRGMNQNRRSNPPKFSNDRSYSSPSSNYNYSSGNSYNSGNNSNYNGQHSQSHHQQRRRPDNNNTRSFKPHHNNNNDRIIKQNDIIIRLLKEIRDRLPAPPAGVSTDETTNESEYFEQDRVSQTDTNENNSAEEVSEVLEPAENFDADQEQDEYSEDNQNR